MNGFEQSGIDPHDTVPGRVLKFLLRTNMPELRTRIMRRIEQAYGQVLSKGKPSKNGNYPPGLVLSTGYESLLI
jgi:hypothetical protein